MVTAIIGVAGALWLMLRPCGWDARLGRPGFDDPVAALAFVASGSHEEPRLWVGGYFQKAGDVAVSGLAHWNGGRWSPGPALNGPVRAMRVFNAGEGASLIVAGQFTRARGLPVNYIVRFDGERWLPMAGGFDHWVAALEVFDDGVHGPTLYAGGYFREGGNGAELHHIARWTGTDWVSEADGLNGPVRALHAHSIGGEDVLVAAGEFTRAGDVEAPHVAAWNGQQWIDLGGGFDQPVLALAAIRSGPAQGLYAGGRFAQSGGESASRIARWDEASRRWRGLGEGLDQDVLVMAPLGDSILVGGRFLRAGSARAAHIAQWDARKQGWSALGSGTDGPVQALLIDPGDDRVVYVGGNFTRAGLRESRRVAIWRDYR